MGTSAEKGASADKRKSISSTRNLASRLCMPLSVHLRRKVIIEIPSEKGVDLYFLPAIVRLLYSDTICFQAAAVQFRCGDLACGTVYMAEAIRIMLKN